jgi:hypothetical protein
MIEEHSKGTTEKTGREPEVLPDFPINEIVDPAVRLPRDIQATIARGEEAANEQVRIRSSVNTSTEFIMSIVDQKIQDQPDSILDAKAQGAKGKRQQPPMIERLHFVLILVDWFERRGMSFEVSRKSNMNKAVRKWLHEKAKHPKNRRKSRRKEISADAVRTLLKQVRQLRGGNDD